MFPQFVCLIASMLSQSVVTGGSGSSQRLQDAIDACPATGCVIELPDSLYLLSNRLWIEGKTDLKIAGTGTRKPILAWDDSLLLEDAQQIAAQFRLAPPTGGGRPKLPKGWLMWPYAYKSGVGTASDSSVPFSTTGYQHNGMVMVKKSSRIVLDGLVLDGRNPKSFLNKSVWDGLYNLFFGSLGVSLLRSLAVDVRNCELRNFWSAIYINDRNPSCQAWANTIGRSDTGANPWSACGTMGGHLIERNRIHGNWWAVYSEAEWDQGSVIRENLAWDNTNRNIYAIQKSEESGGFLYSKDDLMPVHTLTHNTIYQNTSPYGYDMYRITGTAFWSDNIIHVPDSAGLRPTSGNSFHALDDYTASGNHLWNTTLLSYTHRYLVDTLRSAPFIDSSIHFQGPIAIPRDTTVILKNGKLVDSIGYDTIIGDKHCGSGCTGKLVTPQPILHYYGLPWSLSYTPTGSGTVQVKGPDSLVHTELVRASGLGDSAVQLKYAGQDSATARLHANWLCRFCTFASLDSTSPDFLVPDSASKNVQASLLRRDTVGGHRGATGYGGALGAHVPVRLRPRGVPRLDGSVLRLPVSISTEGVKVDAMAVRRIQVTFRGLDSAGSCFIPENGAGVDDPRKVPSFLPTDTVISIPILYLNNYVYQIDLWPVGISGRDTIAATPLAWVWIPGMNGGSFKVPTTGVAASLRPRISLTADGTLLIRGDAREVLILSDAAGRMVSVATSSVPGGRTASLRSLRPGVWFARLPGGAQRLLITP